MNVCEMCGNLGASVRVFVFMVRVQGREAWEETSVRACAQCAQSDDVAQELARMLREAWGGPLG
jgi:hypothetical protein